MKLKHGVRILGLRPEILLAMCIADSVYATYGVELVITSVTDGKHSAGSKHYSGFAFDARTRNVDDQGQLPSIRDDLKDSLGADFDVVLEKDHFHIEFDPKTAINT